MFHGFLISVSGGGGQFYSFALAETASSSDRTRGGVDPRTSLGAVAKTEFLLILVFQPLIRLNFCRVTNGLSDVSTDVKWSFTGKVRRRCG